MSDAKTGREVKQKPPYIWAGIALLVAALLVCAAVLPEIDMAVSGLFHEAGHGFYMADYFAFICFHALAYYGARILGAVLLILALYTYFKKQKIWHVDAKGWTFLFIALMIAPVLIGNVALKDHWGRARPREITEFGGKDNFSPALSPQPFKHKNGSFVSGDAAFGFYLPCFAYVVPRERKKLSRRVFWGGMLAGAMFGVTRIVMGAHFFSDVLFAAFFMLGASAIVHAVMFGRRETVMRWRNWFFDRKILP